VADGSPGPMADRVRVASLIQSRITVHEEASKNGCRCRETILERCGLLDMRAQAEVPSALRADTRMALSSSVNTCLKTSYVNRLKFGAEMSALHNPGLY